MEKTIKKTVKTFFVNKNRRNADFALIKHITSQNASFINLFNWLNQG